MKTITIDGKEYKIDCNAFTYVKYKQIFKTGIIEDIQKIQTFVAIQTINKQRLEKENPNITDEELEFRLGELMMDTVDEFIEVITKITWILIYSVNSDVKDYETWLKTITNFSINDKWIVEVTEFAVSCFR